MTVLDNGAKMKYHWPLNSWPIHTSLGVALRCDRCRREPWLRARTLALNILAALEVYRYLRGNRVRNRTRWETVRIVARVQWAQARDIVLRGGFVPR